MNPSPFHSPFAKPATIQQPVIQSTEVTNRPLPPFEMPKVEPGEVVKPYVCGVQPFIRGKRNPIHQVIVGGQVFPQFVLPMDFSLPDAGRFITPTLPIVALSEKQRAALLERAKLIDWGDTFRPPESDKMALRGRHDGKVSELIFIVEYKADANPFALAEAALQAGIEAAKLQDTEKVLEGGDETAQYEQELIDNNLPPQRAEYKTPEDAKADVDAEPKRGKKK